MIYIILAGVDWNLRYFINNKKRVISFSGKIKYMNHAFERLSKELSIF